MQNLLRETEAAKFLNIAPSTLRRWRVDGSGPAFTKIGGAVRYPIGCLLEFIDQKLRNPTGKEGEKN